MNQGWVGIDPFAMNYTIMNDSHHHERGRMTKSGPRASQLFLWDFLSISTRLRNYWTKCQNRTRDPKVRFKPHNIASCSVFLEATTKVGEVEYEISLIALKLFPSFSGPKNMQKTYILLFRNINQSGTYINVTDIGKIGLMGNPLFRKMGLPP